MQLREAREARTQVIEAYRLHAHDSTLALFLASIEAYLVPPSAPSISRCRNSTTPLGYKVEA